jgi:HEAT repeat protein
VDEVEKLIIDLGSKDELIRESAAKRLGELRDSRAVPALIEIISNDNIDTASEAAKAVESIGDPSSIKLLLDLLEKPLLKYFFIYDLAADAIGNIALRNPGHYYTARSVPFLINIQEKSSMRDVGIGNSLVKIGTHKHVRHYDDSGMAFLVSIVPKEEVVVPLLIDLLGDADYEVRIETVMALGHLAERGISIAKAIPKLTSFIEGADEQTLIRVSWVLIKAWENGDDILIAVPPLFPALEIQSESLVSHNIKKILLNLIRDEKASAGMLSIIGNLLSCKDSLAKYDAIRLLGESGRIFFVPLLIDALKDNSMRLEISLALEKICMECTTMESISRMEIKALEGINDLRKGLMKRDFLEIGFEIAKLKMAIAKKKNELSKDKGILLDDKPKPPRRNKMYQRLRISRTC